MNFCLPPTIILVFLSAIFSRRFAEGLPLLKSLTVEKIPSEQQQSQQLDPVKLALLSGAACLFLGGRACSPNGNDRIPTDVNHQLNGDAKIGTAQGLTLPILKPILGVENFDTYRGTDVNIGQPRVSAGQAVDILGLYQQQQGVRDAGVRGRGNYGVAWGDHTSFLGNLLGYGDVNDVNFNVERLRLDSDRRSGLSGLYEETYRTVFDPLNLKYDRIKQTCYARLLLGGKGICTEQAAGLAPPLST